MKKCPFCAEEIQDDAVKCRHCNEFIMPKQEKQIKWYFRTTSLIVAFLCAGPFMLPLVWFHPTYSQKTKIIVSVIIAGLSYWVTVSTINAVKSITQYYQMVFDQLQ